MSVQLTITNSRSPVANGQGKLILLILVALLPLVAALVMYFGRVGLPAGTTNLGQLVVPPVAEEEHRIALERPGTPWLQADGRRKWLMLVLAPADSASGAEICAAQCRHVLYIVRQVNIALGKDADRVAHVLLDPGLPAELNREDPQRLILPVDMEERQRLHSLLVGRQVDAVPWSVLLMDPLGNIMMRYPPTLNGKDVLEDLKRLLKVSKIG